MENAKSPAEPNYEEFANWMQRNSASKETIRVYCTCLRRWFQHLHGTGLPAAQAWNCWGDVTPQMRRLSGYAIKRFREFQIATGREIVECGALGRLPHPTRPNPAPVSGDELTKLLQAIRNGFPLETSISLRIWVRVLNELGIRRGETPMSWERFDFESKVATVEVVGKTGRRTLPIPERLLRVLKWLRRRREGSPWLGARNQALSVDTLYQLFKRAARMAEIPQLKPHRLRHSFLTRLCRSQLGQNQLLVLAIAGHSHVSSLQHYYRVSTEEMAMALLAAKMPTPVELHQPI